MAAMGILRTDAVALVTGAGSGIGRAVAEALLAQGLKVIACGRDRARLAALPQGERLLARAFDLTDKAAVAALPGGLPEPWRSVAVLVNAAGHDLGGRRRFDRADPDDMAEVIAANLTGTLRLTRALLPGMLERGEGHVVNIGSAQGVLVFPGAAAYTASKHAVHGLSKAIRADLHGTGVRVTEILPGLVKSGFAAARWRGDEKRAEAFYADFKTMMQPEDVARAVLYALAQPPHMCVAELHLMPTA